MTCEKSRRTKRENGFTLIEVLVSVAVTGMIVATLSVATITVFKTRASTTGRANNARSEQVVGMWMPGDLASAEVVDTTAGAVPCGPSPACPPTANVGGSNAVMLIWTSSEIDGSGNAVTTRTAVSYRVIEVAGEYQMVRVKCVTVGAGAPTCQTITVLHNLESPPAGMTFRPGIDSPSWVITVSNALAPDDTSGPDATIPPPDPGLKNKNGQRVVVTINGGGTIAGAGGGENQITLSAGGTDRQLNLSTSDLTGAPTFTAARSRCGGNFAMLVDTSGSITQTQMTAVKSGIRNFIDTFAGTPIKLEVVRFSDTASALGATGGEWVHYYDMLIDSDIAALKTLVGDPAVTTSGLQRGGSTNWEDGVFRVLKNSDGTVQANPPNTIIFFTDGVPTRSRLEGTSASAPAVADPADGGLPATDGSSLYQIGWNRAERIIRDRGKVTMIGVFVGSATASSQWKTAGAGYHWLYQMGNTVVFQHGYHAGYQVGNAMSFEKGYHQTYEMGNAVLFERGYHGTSYQVGNMVSFEKGYHITYDRNNNVVWQMAQSGVAYERYSGGSWKSTTFSTYLSNNSTPDSSDNYRMRVTGSLGNWTAVTSAQYDDSNVVAASTDGVRTNVSSLSPTWTSVTAAEYNGSNTTTDSTDGWRTTNVYTAPFDTWEASTQATYLASNTAAGPADGWRATATGTSTTWTNITSAQFDASDTTTDSSDGFRVNGQTYTSPYDAWEPATQSAYLTGNTSTLSTDGWRMSATGTSTSWSAITAAQYAMSNTTADSTDGVRTTIVYSSPFDSWEASNVASFLAANTNNTSSDGWRSTPTGASTTWTDITSTQYTAANTTADSSDGWQSPDTFTSPYNSWATVPQATYDAGNTAAGSTDGWRTTTSGPVTSWTDVSKAAYDLSNSTSSDGTDGWQALKVYEPPFTAFEGVSSKSILDYATLGNIVVDNTSGDAGSFVQAVLSGGVYTNASVADLFVLPDYSQFSQALSTVALGQCGGTVTMQTRVGANPAQDPFTYQIAPSNEIVQTSAAYRSGTFDVALPGGASQTVTIAPQDFTDLVRYAPVGWTCKSGGVSYPFTVAPIAGHAPWTSIQLTVGPNQAVSCIQSVTFS